VPGKTEVQMNTKTKLSLVAILASCFCMAIGSAQAAARHHQALWLVLPSQAL
jgi:hypothetical protein